MGKNIKEAIAENRDFMKSHFGREEVVSAQDNKLVQPPLVKPALSGEKIELTRDFSCAVTEHDYVKIMENRISSRFYAAEPMTLEQLSFLLWSTQSVRAIRGNNYAALRFVPSGGARHAFETYLAVANVRGLEEGIYHYLPMEHALELVSKEGEIGEKVVEVACNQKWAGKAAATFMYTAVAYRAEWRYSINAHRVMLIDVGHVVQNLYLSCGAVNCGTCAIAAFDQSKTDSLLHVDGDEEFTIYMAPVGVFDAKGNDLGNKKLYSNV